MTVSRSDERLLVETGFGWTRLARLRDGSAIDDASGAVGGDLVEIEFFFDANRSRVGDIVLGRVVRRERGLDAAFVDIGAARPALLRAADSRHFDPPGLPDEGRSVMVQVDRDADPAADKGPRVTSRIRIAGAAAVYAPQEPGIALPGRTSGLVAAAARSALRGRLAPGEGVILRSALVDRLHAGISLDGALPETALAAIEADLAMARPIWAAAHAAAGESRPPCLLRRGPDWPEAVAAAIAEGVAVMVDCRIGAVDGRPAGAALQAALGKRMSHPSDAVTGGIPIDGIGWHDGPDRLFAAAGVEGQIAAALDPVVPLPGGGRLIIEPTAALTAIDVDSAGASARSGRDGGPQGLATRVNRQAVAAIARELRLRRLGGLIVVDFLEQTDRRDRAALVAALEAAVSTDPAPVRVSPMSDGRLVSLTRRWQGPSLSALLTDRCRVCDGQARQPAALPSALAALAALPGAVRRSPGAVPDLRVAADIAAVLEGPAREALRACEASLGQKVAVVTATDISPGAWEFAPKSNQARSSGE